MEIVKNELLVGKAFEELTFEEMALSQGIDDMDRKIVVAPTTIKCALLTFGVSVVVSLVAC